MEKRKNELKEKLAATSKAKKKGMESQLDKLIAEKNSLDHAQKFASNVLGYRCVKTMLPKRQDLEQTNRVEAKQPFCVCTVKLLNKPELFTCINFLSLNIGHIR